MNTVKTMMMIMMYLDSMRMSQKKNRKKRNKGLERET